MSGLVDADVRSTMRIPMIAAAILIAAVLGAAASARAQDSIGAVGQLADQIARVLPADGQVRIIVTDFDDNHGVTSDYSRYLADLLILQLGRTPRLLPIERRHLRIVLGQFQLRGGDLAKRDNVRKVASQFHADVLLLDGLTELDAQVALDAKVIDVTSGDALGFASAGVAKDARVQRMLETGRQ